MEKTTFIVSRAGAKLPFAHCFECSLKPNIPLDGTALSSKFEIGHTIIETYDCEAAVDSYKVINGLIGPNLYRIWVTFY